MFETFAKLEILDGTDKNGDEVEEEVIIQILFFVYLYIMCCFKEQSEHISAF